MAAEARRRCWLRWWLDCSLHLPEQVERLLRDEPAKLLADAKTVSGASQVIGQVKDRLAQRSAMAMFLGAESQRLVGELAAAGCKLVGDVDFAEVSQRCFAITPVPGGVGPMTIAGLLRNTMKSFERRVYFGA